MGAIEDSRKVLQDFLAPELRAIAVRLDALEKRFDGRLDGLEKRLDDSDRRSERMHDEVLSAIARMGEVTSLRERVARLESRDQPHQ
jgi:septal ring factor EnvC (AmiA/AmiB activator)